MAKENKNGGIALKERSAPQNKTPQTARPGAWWDQLVCRWTVWRWKQSIKAEKRSKKFWRKAMSISAVAEFGEFTYMMGFWAEYVLLLTGRGLRRAARLLAHECGKIYTMRVLPVLRLVYDIFADVFAPIAECVVGIKHVRAARKQAAENHQKLEPAYFLQGMARYAAVLARGAACLLPFAAAAVFAVTVKTTLSQNYVLAVQVNGDTVGYVASEQVFDDARTNLNERIERAREGMNLGDAENAEQKQFEINPTFMLRVSKEEVLDEKEMADAILRASSDQIQEATALYVDGHLRAITTQGDDLRRFLEDFKAPYEDPNDPDMRVEFVKDIELVDGVYFTDSIMDYADIVNMLNGKEQEEKVYVVQAGDTPWMIAAANDLTLNELYELNPEMTSKSYQMYVGDELVVAQEMDFLQVKQVATRTWQEEIAYDTKTTNSEEYDWGVTKTITAGQNGLKEVTADITYINGVKVSTEVLNETILVEPVTEEIIKGTHLKSGMVAQYGTGNFIWPVPNYKYVSRWMSSGHTGADICAAYGTPIIACDAGVVVKSGWHYSYGNHVVINHGNGYQTLYAHMAYSPSVSVGQSVSQGQVIGYVGSTGNSYGNHCHLEMFYNGVRFSARNVFPGM